MDESFNKCLKVVLLGDSGVGKTSIINRYTKDVFDAIMPSTIGGTFTSKILNFDEHNCAIKFDIWDTAGQEKYKSIAKLYYQNSDVIIFVYDITSRQSFECLQTYYETVSNSIDVSKVIFTVVGNKSDLYEQETVTRIEGENYAKSIGAKFKLVSAKSDIGIDGLFLDIGKGFLIKEKLIKTKDYGYNRGGNIKLEADREEKDKDVVVKEDKCGC